MRSYLDVLTSTFMVRQLQPWHENVGKRQRKAPKVYLRDTGMLHTLLGIENPTALGDIGLIERAMGNLLENAVRYTPAAGHVRILRDDLAWTGDSVRYNFKTRMMEAERFRRMREVTKMFADVGLQAVHENCMNYGGLSWQHALRLLDNVPGLK